MERVAFSCASGSFVRWASTHYYFILRQERDSRNLGMNKVLARMRLWRMGKAPPFFLAFVFLRTCMRLTCPRNPAMHIDVRETYAPVDSLGRVSRMNRIASAICPRKLQRTT